MAEEIRSFAVTIPAGTAIAAPLLTNLAMPTRVVDEIDIVIPPGPNGLVGFAIAAAGVSVIPYNANAWIIGSGESIRWPLAIPITSGAWQFKGYNTGVFDHTIQIRFLLSQVTKRTPTVARLISNADLSGNLTPETVLPLVPSQP